MSTSVGARTFDVPPQRVKRARMVAALIGMLGTAALILITFQSPETGFVAYLFAYVTAITVVVGALLQVMIGYMTGADWFVELRPRAMRIAGTLPAMTFLFLPVAFGLRYIYPWVVPSRLPIDVQRVVVRQHGWLNGAFFVSRAVFYLAAWVVTAELLRRAVALESNPATTPAPKVHARRISAAGLIVVSLTFTFAAFDWVMSLEAGWYSTAFGVYLFAGGILGALAMIALTGAVSARGIVSSSMSERQRVALAKLLLTFAMFWIYIAFMQYLIIWIADIPSEVSWYITRLDLQWRWYALLIITGQFVVPFAFLLSYRGKRSARVLTAVACAVIVAHVLECYWMVVPALRNTNILAPLAAISALALVAGVTTTVGLLRAPVLDSHVVYTDEERGMRPDHSASPANAPDIHTSTAR